MSTAPPAADPIVAKLDRAIFAFLLVKRRYPLLIETAAEMERLRKRSDVRPRSNDAAIQIMRDSFDMLVIDLYSIRESMLARGGVFDLLKDSPERLWPKLSSSPDPHLAAIVSSGVRKVAEELTGTDQPATVAIVKALCAQFRKQTKPLDSDRNRVRAHRYEQESDTSKLFIVLPDLQGQIDIVQRYLHGLYLIVTNIHYSMDMSFAAGPEHLSKDLADVIVHGSINGAVSYYGMAKKTPEADPVVLARAARDPERTRRARRMNDVTNAAAETRRVQ